MSNLHREIIMQIRAALTLAWLNGIVAAVRTPLWVASYLTPPLSILVILGFLARKEALAFGVIGGLTMILVYNGLGLMADAAFYRIYLKFQDMIVAGPVRPWSYMMGLALSGLLFSAPGIAVFAIVMEILGITVHDWVEVVAASVLLWAAGSSMGFAISSTFKEMREVWPTTAILTFAISVLPPVYYPRTILPYWASLASLVTPTASAALLLQDSMGMVPASLPETIIAYIVLIVETAAFLVYSSRRPS